MRELHLNIALIGKILSNIVTKGKNKVTLLVVNVTKNVTSTHNNVTFTHNNMTFTHNNMIFISEKIVMILKITNSKRGILYVK